MIRFLPNIPTIIREAKNYDELLRLAALPLIAKIKEQGLEVAITLGCMTSGGYADRMNIPRDRDGETKFYDTNIKVFETNQDLLRSYLDDNIILFDQTIFESAFRRINSDGYSWEMMKQQFYYPLFEEGGFSEVYMQYYWNKSTGAKDEVKEFMEYDIPIFEMPKESHKMTSAVLNRILQTTKPATNKQLENKMNIVMF
jgi:hypothetical protein